MFVMHTDFIGVVMPLGNDFNFTPFPPKHKKNRAHHYEGAVTTISVRNFR